MCTDFGGDVIIVRDMVSVLMDRAKQFPVVSIFGPRQSGKTTLAKAAFSDYRYFNLERVAERKFAQENPEEFLERFAGEKGVILDEVQHVPDLLSYIQVYVDESERPGFFVLTGSQNFLLNQNISQTLAGRVAILTLLPFSVGELKKEQKLFADPIKVMFKGSYPRIVAQQIAPQNWYPEYIQTYLERDVRQIKNVENLSLFRNFVQLCAGRIGQLLNVSSLATDCGISVKTAQSWLSLLECSYIIFLLRPYHKNFNKRITKSPKLYFYDTGLACNLLGIEDEERLRGHYLRGGLFESFVISELAKHAYNHGRRPKMFFWRDNHGHEVDCLLESGQALHAIEIKSGKTVNTSFFDGLLYWRDMAKDEQTEEFLVYLGDEHYVRKGVSVVGWQEVAQCVQKV